MSRFRSGVLLTLTIALIAFLMCAAVSSMAQSLPTAVKPLVFIGPNSTRSITVRGTVTLRPSVPPNAGVTSVVYYLDGNGIGTVKAVPFKLDWDSTAKDDGEYLLKAIGSTDSGQEVWTGEGKIIVANKTPAQAPPSPVVPPTMTPAVRPPAPIVKPTPRPPLPATVAVNPAAAKPAGMAKPATTSKPIIKPVPKPVVPPMVVAQAPPKTVTKPPAVASVTQKPASRSEVMTPATHPAVPVAPKPPVVTPKPVPAVKPIQKPVVKPKPAVKPAMVAKPKPPVKVSPNPATVAWKTYTNSKYSFTAEYPGTARIQNESSHMKPKGPGTFWIAFTQTSSGKPWYAINVRHMKTNESGTPDKFAKYNPYLLSWDRTNVAGLDGFKTVSGRASSKRVIHRTLLVSDRDVWMLNLTDVSGNDSNITGGIFKRFIDSFRPEGAVGVDRPVPVAPARGMNRTGYPTPPRRTTVESVPVPPPAPAPEEAPPPPAPGDSGYNSGE